MPKMVTILGPTASGKTDLAIKLAKKYNGEIICADSRTIYKEMDIGTAKPSVEEQKIVSHHLLDIASPDQTFNVADFKQLALKRINDIHQRGNIPFLVGGSGMYIDAILFDYSFERENKPINIDTQELSLEELRSRVELEFPEIQLNNSDINNPRRLEQILSRGIVKSTDRTEQKIESLVLGIEVKIPIIKQNIALRTKSMLNKGFIQEVQNIIQKYGDDCTQLQTIGYKEVLNYLQFNEQESLLEDQINTATYKLAKKQTTWFKRNPNIVWIRDYEEAEGKVSDYLSL